MSRTIPTTSLSHPGPRVHAAAAGLLFLLLAIAGIPVAEAAGPPVSSCGETFSEYAKQRILLINYDPVMDNLAGDQDADCDPSTLHLSTCFDWGDPLSMTAEYHQILDQSSGGFGNFEIVEEVLIEDYPTQWNDYQYTDERWYHRFKNGGFRNFLGMPDDVPEGWRRLGNSPQESRHAQTFTAEGTSQIEAVVIGLSRFGKPAQQITLKLEDAAGNVLWSDTIQPSEVISSDPLDPTWVSREVYRGVQDDQQYALAVEMATPDFANHYRISYRADSYAGGQLLVGQAGTPSVFDMAAKVRFNHGMDYQHLLTMETFLVGGVHSTIADHVLAGRLDDVYVWGGPWFGFWESSLAGPGAFYVNGGVYGNIQSGRAFTIMGFNYQREVANMLHNLSHRTEATMSHLYGGWEVDQLIHDWARFAANAAQSNGFAGCGTTHFPPNAPVGYEYWNMNPVDSYCESFCDYPAFEMSQTASTTAGTWYFADPCTDRSGNPDYQCSYFDWWFLHLPRAAGVNTHDGQLHLNNWWRYLLKPEVYKAGGPVTMPINLPPTANAGPDVTVESDTMTLVGAATDDGLPSGLAMRYFWSQVSGPGSTTLLGPDPSDPTVTVSFDQLGTYTFELEVDDGELAAADTVTVTVTAPACGSCEFDTRTFVDVGGTLVESITAYGDYWNFDATSGALISSGTLTDVGRYSAPDGPCDSGSPCTFDTRTFEDLSYGQAEVITAGGNYWEYSYPAGVLTGSGLLSQRDGSRYSEPGGPCEYHPADCSFDTRSVSDGTEVVTAYFQRWTYVWSGAPPFGLGWVLDTAEDLGQTEYWPAGPCEDAPFIPGAPLLCVLDSMAHGFGAVSITAYDRFWNYDVGDPTPWPGSGACLIDVDRYRSENGGPCT